MIDGEIYESLSKSVKSLSILSPSKSHPESRISTLVLLAGGIKDALSHFPLFPIFDVSPIGSELSSFAFGSFLGCFSDDAALPLCGTQLLFHQEMFSYSRKSIHSLSWTQH